MSVLPMTCLTTTRPWWVRSIGSPHSAQLPESLETPQRELAG